MKKLLLALSFLLTSPTAWAQCTGVFPPNTLCGNLTGNPNPPSAFAPNTSLTIIYTPEEFGAVGNGVTDDTTALTNMCIAADAAGPGGIIYFGINKTYAVNKTVTFNDNAVHTMCLLTKGGLTIEGNGAIVKDFATYGGASTTWGAFAYAAGQQYVLNNINCVQVNAVVLPVANVIGGECVMGTGAAKLVQINNITMAGGLAAVGVFGTGSSNWSIVNFYTTDTAYGVNTPGGASHSYISGTCIHVERCAFTYKTSHQEWHITSQDNVSNDFLIGAGAPGCTGSNVTSDMDIWYRVLPRTIGLYGSYLTFALGSVGCVQTIANIRAHVDFDLSGDNAAGAANPILMATNGGSMAGQTIQNITIDGVIRNVGASHVSRMIDWNSSAPSASDFHSNITFRNLTISGSSVPNVFFDMLAFQTNQPGLYLENVNIPGGIGFGNDSTLKRSYGPGVFITGVRQPYGCKVLNGGTSDAQTPQAINTVQFYGPAGYSGGSYSNGVVLPSAGTLSQLGVSVSGALAGVTDTAILNIGGDLTLTCSITGPAATCSDTTHSDTVGAGTIVWVKYTTGNGGTTRAISWTMQFCTP